MKILFCNITYMKKYIGITEDDMPSKGGAWVEKNNDAHEQWNFLNVDGYCYGFVMNRGNQFAIERIDESASKADEVDDVTVVWCARNDSNETVIVGWYEHATVYRHFQESVITPIYGIDRMYFCKANANDCYLLPEDKRYFTIGRASEDGSGKGFGQQNFWYAESAYARSELLLPLSIYLENHKDDRINRTNESFDSEDINIPLSEAQIEKANELFSNGDYFEFLPYGYRIFFKTESADSAHDIASALSALHQYDSAIKWHRTVISIEGKTWENCCCLPYLYQQRELHQEAIEAALDLLKYDEAKNDDTKHEIYGIIADSLYKQNKVNDAIEWLDKIITESKDNDLIQHTISVKTSWEHQ